MEDVSSNNKENVGGRRKLVLVVLSLIALVLAMIASIYYPYPSGKTLGIAGFIALWFREILILGTVVALFVAIGCAWLWKMVRKPVARSQGAP